MACALTQDFNLDCRDSIGGVKVVYLIEIGNISAITDSSGVVSAITKTVGTTFRKYALIRDTSKFSETLTTNEQNGTNYSAQSGEIILNKRQANTRNEIMLLAKNNVAVIAVDNNGKGWLYGREFGMVLSGAVAESGTAWGDRNGYTLPFTGTERELAYEVSSICLGTLQS